MVRCITDRLGDVHAHHVGRSSSVHSWVGIIEIVAGLVVLLAPRFGGPLVAAWLGEIIINLLIIGGYGDVALRDFGLLLAAAVLARLAWAYPTKLPTQR